MENLLLIIPFHQSESKYFYASYAKHIIICNKLQEQPLNPINDFKSAYMSRDSKITLLLKTEILKLILTKYGKSRKETSYED